jgi:two-component system heavy metal sensor histidine kinase CusS
MYWGLEQNLDHKDDQALAYGVQMYRGLIRERPDDTILLQKQLDRRRPRAGRRNPRLVVRILDESGHVLAQTPDSDAVFEGATLVPAPVDVESGPGVNLTGRNKPFRALAAWAQSVAPPHTRRLLQIAVDRTSAVEMLAAFRSALYIILFVALVVAKGVGYVIARRAMRPLAAITETARRIGSRTLNERMSTAHLPSELRSLANTFNQMLQRLEDAFTRLSSLSADLAHELRTPINNVRGELEVALGKPRTADSYRVSLESALEECVRLSETIDALLFLARADFTDAQIIPVYLDVRRELQAVREFYDPAAAEAGIALEVRVNGDVDGVTLDRTLFQRAVSNLMTNAIAHTPAAGQVQVTAMSTGEALEVSVADTGSGIPEAYVTRVTERFYRVVPSRSATSGGLGLGLAIVHSIMKLHGGFMRIASRSGIGTTVTLVFPRALPSRADR